MTIAIVTRVLSLCYLVLVHPPIVSSDAAFDTSTSILLAAPGTSSSTKLARFLDPFVKWDNLYFSQIALRGYQHEQELAFMPIWPLMMRWSGMFVRLLLKSTPSPSIQALDMTDVVLGGVILTNVISVLNVVVFQK